MLNVNHTLTGNSWLVQGKTNICPCLHLAHQCYSFLKFFLCEHLKHVDEPMYNDTSKPAKKPNSSILQAFKKERVLQRTALTCDDRWKDVLSEIWTNFSISLIKETHLNVPQIFLLSRWILTLAVVLLLIWNVIITNCLRILKWLLIMSIISIVFLERDIINCHSLRIRQMSL